MAHLLLQAFLIFAVFGALNCGPSTYRTTAVPNEHSSHDGSSKDPNDNSHHLASSQQGRVARDTLAVPKTISHHASEDLNSSIYDPAVHQPSRIARDIPVSLESHAHIHHDGSSSEESKESKEHDSHLPKPGQQSRVARNSPTPPTPHKDEHSHDLHSVSLEKQPLHLPAGANVKRPARATEEKHEHTEDDNAETRESIPPIPNPAIQPSPLLLDELRSGDRQIRDTPVSKNPQQEGVNQHHSEDPQVQPHLTVPSHESEYNRHTRDTAKASSTPQDSHLPAPKPKEEPKSDEHKHDHH